MPVRITCTCGGTLVVPDEYIGKRVRCGDCRTVLTVPGSQPIVQLEPPVPASEARASAGLPMAAEEDKLSEVMRANRKVAGKTCPLCRVEIKLGEDITNCPHCRLPHHSACWTENGGCSTYGCQSGPRGSSPDVVVSKHEVVSAPGLGHVQGPPTYPSNRKTGRAVKWGFVALLLGAVICWVYVSSEDRKLKALLDQVIAEDARNSGIDAAPYESRDHSRRILTFDIRRVSGKSRLDVFRVLTQYAEKLSANGLSYDEVQLACRGKVKFLLPGADFSTLGREYSWQNPMYTIRAFPEKLANPDGSKAFPAWTGGALGVLNKQMEDFTEFHNRWYWQDD